MKPKKTRSVLILFFGAKWVNITIYVPVTG